MTNHLKRRHFLSMVLGYCSLPLFPWRKAIDPDHGYYWKHETGRTVMELYSDGKLMSGQEIEAWMAKSEGKMLSELFDAWSKITWINRDSIPAPLFLGDFKLADAQQPTSSVK
jgi:regulatory protein YycH of two-component signal transduction system YycFG